MKFYAEVTGDKMTGQLVSKGQGGQSFLEIPIYVEQSDGNRAQLCKVRVKLLVNHDYRDQRDYVATVVHNFEEKEVARIEETNTKGERQKGDQCPLCRGALDHNGYCAHCKWSVR